MELGPTWDAASHSATQKLPNILWSPKIHYRDQKIPELVPILRQINSLHITPYYLSKIHSLLSSHVSLGIPSGLFPSGFPTKIRYAFYTWNL
jgi:hypothetical protein